MESLALFLLLFVPAITLVHLLYAIFVRPVLLDSLRYRAFAARDALYRMERKGRLQSDADRLLHERTIQMANAIIASLGGVNLVVLTLTRMSLDPAQVEEVRNAFQQVQSEELHRVCLDLCATTRRVIAINSIVYVIALSLLGRAIRGYLRGVQLLDALAERVGVRLYRDMWRLSRSLQAC